MMIYHFTIYLSYKQMVIFPFAKNHISSSRVSHTDQGLENVQLQGLHSKQVPFVEQTS